MQKLFAQLFLEKAAEAFKIHELLKRLDPNF